MINKKTLSEQLYESIKQDILDRKIDFGEKLVNRELQEKYGVSSTPVRDAINRLYQDGLVEDISKGGARVISFDLDVAKELNEIVSFLNISAVKMSAAKSGTQKVTPILEQCIACQMEHIKSDEYFEYDFLFHNTFFEYSKNTRYQQLYAQYHTLWELLVKFYYFDKEKTKANAISQHQRITYAYKCGDIQLAQYIMEQHFLDAVNPLGQALRKKKMVEAEMEKRLISEQFPE